MIQQINLYQDNIRQAQAKTAVNPYLAGFAGIILLLMGISLNLLWNLGNLKTRMEQTRKSLTVEEARVNDLLSKLPNQGNNASLLTETDQLQSNIGELTQILQLLTEKKTDLTQGFSKTFQALANQSVPDVWLSKIYIFGPRRIFDLEGSALKSAQIPFFLQQLQKEPVFHGQTFAKLIMLKSEKFPGQINFKLNTTLDPKQQ